MNRTFKTIWSTARQQYIVSDEKHASRGKAAKATMTAVAVAAMFAAGSAVAAYVPAELADSPTQNVDSYAGDPGRIGDKASWETQEYQKNWGLSALKASSAYALGFHGQGVKVGMMDSGILEGHVELSGDRWHAVQASGEYSQDGVYYPQNKPGSQQEYHKGQKFDLNGYYNPEYNDNHGTGCAGVYAGNRNGSGMHGVAWGSEFYSANTGGNDNTNYGPFPDYGFFKTGYDALVDAGVKIINNSFGTNLKQVDENGNILDYYHSGPELTTVNDIEYEYFLFKKMYKEGPSFVDAAWEAVKDKDVIQVFTNGNNDRANPYHRALYPYFKPEAEKQWIAIAGLRQNDKNADPDNYRLEANFNEAGYAKYWTMAGPGQNGYTSNISGGYGGYSGTSMAAPFVSGAFAVLASRYQDMSAVQVREVLLTTANHKNADGTNMYGWDNVDGTTPLEGQVSDRMGWGVPDLEKGMYGPGQFFNGKFSYNLNSYDVWSNDISQVALDQRYDEDIEWLKSVTNDHTIEGQVVVSNNPDDYKLTNTSTGSANADGKDHNYDLAGIPDKDVALTDAMKWRGEYYNERAEAIRKKLADGDYNGSLVKSGEGTLVMTGRNTYKGTTTVEGGTLLAFSESIGADDTVTVTSGGTFGVLSSYDDTFTLTGYKKSTASDEELVSIVVEEGGSLYVSAAGDVTVQSVEGAPNVKFGLEGADRKALAQAYVGDGKLSGTFTTKDGSLKDAVIEETKLDSLFFDTATGAVSEDGKSITTSITKKEGVTLAQFAQTDNQRAIAEAIAVSGNAFAGGVLSLGTAEEVTATYSALTDDMYASARNAMVMNAAAVSHMVMDQARGMGEGRSVELENGKARLWATGMGLWGNAEGVQNDLDVDFRVGLVGGEFVAHETTKLGAFFGYGSTDYNGNLGKIDGDDMHFGVYGLTDLGQVSLSYGVAYTTEDRDSQHMLGASASTHSEDATVLQAYAEAAYRFEAAGMKIDPYVGFSWIRAETDGFAEAFGTESMKVKDQKDDIQVATIGARVAVPFMMGTMPVTVKADAGWSRYFGDNESVMQMQMGAGGAYAQIEGNELKNQFNLGFGVTGQVAKSATVGVSYVGAFGSDADNHGLIANFRYAF